MRPTLGILLVVAAATGLTLAPAELAAPRLVAANANRAQIRSLPITARPDRPGHFVGNAVRRRYRSGGVVAPIRPGVGR